MANKAAFILLIFCLGCDSHSQVFHVYKKGGILPEIVANDRLEKSANLFSRLFEEVTGYHPEIKYRVSAGAKSIITLHIEKKQKPDHFSISTNDNALTIAGGSPEALEKGIRYFFSAYTGYLTPEVYRTGIEMITVPTGLTYKWQPSFEYREPYFRDNFKEGFREWNNTQTLEETWGLWGHNITKAVASTPEMMATIDGKINDEQYCFSSPELENDLAGFIRDNGGLKFMVMPNDNELVCVCDRCKKLGNTNDNASPAVFTLLNKLAAKFPQQEFFSTAYMTTQEPPAFKIAPNAGVMISTMAFPKGVILEKSGKKEVVNKTFDTWKKVAAKIYLWDYAVNYDNYFEPYPTVSIAQQNLKYYKSLGVTGVFMHGSEERFSAFDDLKCYLYAQLLQNVDIDVKEYAERFFMAKYPVTGKMLSVYYNDMEQAASDSPGQLDIYGGIGQARRKYMDEEKLTAFYDALSDKARNLSGGEAAAVEPILASLAFNKLELLRTKGWAGFNDPRTREFIEKLRSLASLSGIHFYNESNFTVTGYLDQWNTEILKRPYKNLLYGKAVTFKKVPDEEYSNPLMLADGAVGFNDYYNNWLVSTGNILSVEVNAEDVKNAKIVEIDFLNDNRHKIYLPKKVIITIGDRKYEKDVPILNSKTISKYRVSIPVEVRPGDTTIAIQAVKQDDFVKRSTACDELFFK